MSCCYYCTCTTAIVCALSCRVMMCMSVQGQHFMYKSAITVYHVHVPVAWTAQSTVSWNPLGMQIFTPSTCLCYLCYVHLFKSHMLVLLMVILRKFSKFPCFKKHWCSHRYTTFFVIANQTINLPADANVCLKYILILGPMSIVEYRITRLSDRRFSTWLAFPTWLSPADHNYCDVTIKHQVAETSSNINSAHEPWLMYCRLLRRALLYLSSLFDHAWL